MPGRRVWSLVVSSWGKRVLTPLYAGKAGPHPGLVEEVWKMEISLAEKREAIREILERSGAEASGEPSL